MIPDPSDGVLVQGITGRQGTFWTEHMVAAGSKVVAGVSPGRGGQQVHGVPVYDSVAEAASAHEVRSSVLFTPPLATRQAALEALECGVERLVLLAEFVPTHDTMWILAEARQRGAEVLGPNTAGLVVPGSCSLGIMPSFSAHIFRPGRVAVVSRSGSLGTLVCLNVVEAGFGQSVFLGLGGDPIVGFSLAAALRELEAHDLTDAVVAVGEVGGAMEEEAAHVVASMSKPVVAFITGKTAPPGRRMGHAGAIVSGGRGDASSKAVALRSAGAQVADTPSDIGPMLAGMLRSTVPGVL